MTNQPKGLYNKYLVERVDGRDGPGGDREGAQYFVLDLTHDKHALAGLYGYIESLLWSRDIEHDHQHDELIDDLEALAARLGGEAT